MIRTIGLAIRPNVGSFVRVGARPLLAIRSKSNLLTSPLNRISPLLTPKRWFSSDVEELKNEDKNETDISASSTGVIDVKDREEVIIYFDQIYPLALSKYSLKHYIYWFSRFQHYYEDSTIKERILKLANTSESPLSPETKIIDFIPIKRDGGAFVKFQVPHDSTPKELINQICDNFKKNELTDTYKFKLLVDYYPRCFQVKGTPWIEDLRRYPSPRLKVKFEGEPLTEEELYFLFRRYGLIVDIFPPTSTQSYAIILFRNFRSAISAKNCITGIKLNKGKTSLHLQYEQLKKMNYLTDFIVNHQRISVPAILALLTTLAVLIFDPVREWFIQQKVTHKYSLETYKDNRYFRYIYIPYRNVVSWVGSGYDYIDDRVNSNCEKSKELLQGSFSLGLKDGNQFNGTDYDDDDFDDDSAHPNILWMERLEKVKQLKLWIYENINTFIIVKGPKGSGKQEFVLDHTLLPDEKLKKKILYIDCDNLVKARSDNAMLQATAHQLGYFPLFTWTNSILQFIDLGVQGITGQKSGLSESKETQLKNMFLLTTQALRNVALEDYSSYKKAVLRKQRRKDRDGKKSEAIADEDTSPLLEDELLKEDQYLQQHPECKPIIVINKFLLKADSNQDFIYKMIADWTSQVVQSNIAHVIYITHDVGSVQHLTDSLPNQVFKTIGLSDATAKSSKQYVLNQLNGTNYSRSGNIDMCLEPIGGRMLDLQAFIRRVKSGESPDEALDEMVNQAAEQITTFFLNKSIKSTAASEDNWLPAQVWAIMKILCLKDNIDYTELTKNPLFKSNKDTLSTLSTLEKHDLISLSRDKGILSSISTGRPLYREAFKNLVYDDNIFKIYESDYFADLIQIENNKIAKLEDEISKISHISDLKLLKNRLDYVQEKIAASTQNIINYESCIKDIGVTNKSDGMWSKIGL